MGKGKRISVFASGFGSNLQALIDYSASTGLNGEIVLVFSNNRDAYALKRAKNHGIRSEVFNPSDFKNRKAYNLEILKMLESQNIDVVVLAGYMILVGEEIIERYRNRIINIHPALLPSFKGTHGIKDAFEYGVKVTGVTVHFVDEGLDSGPVIMQEPVMLEQDYSIEKLEEEIHKVEHRIYPLAVKYLCEDRLKIDGRRVLIV
jgi:phosphoribosylglycinamide formyltransferase-1